jgi:hypothetical protein
VNLARSLYKGFGITATPQAIIDVMAALATYAVPVVLGCLLKLVSFRANDRDLLLCAAIDNLAVVVFVAMRFAKPQDCILRRRSVTAATPISL